MPTCPWPIEVDACCNDAGVDFDVPEEAEQVENIIAQVSEMMSRWSGFAFGGCSTVRPLDPCGSCRTTCCVSGDCIVLHDTSAVTEVRIFGEVVPEVEYHFDAARGTLCAMPPLQWPTRDPRYAARGQLEVDVMIGAEPDPWAISVANELACELVKSCRGEKCRLPRNATQVSSQGVTITLSDEEMRFALPSVIAWVNSINPHRAMAPARVFSPEVKRQKVLGSRGFSHRYPWR